MIRLGLRLALAGGRGAVVGTILTAAAVAVGTGVLLFALSFAPALSARDDRTAWRDGYVFAPEPGTGTLMLIAEDHIGSDAMLRVHLAPSGAGPAPIPPGVAAMPAPGTAYVSPALSARMAALPPEQLADRVGRIVGLIEPAALASPDELIAVIGAEPDLLRAQGGSDVSAFATTAPPLDLPPIGLLIIVLAAVGAIAPVAVFVSTATRMTAARRESRLAALRLVGATPSQVARLAVIEALLATSLGAIAGIGLFLITRPLIARIPLDAMTWWPETIAPSLPAMIVLLFVIQLVGAGGALVAMRRLTVTPLGVQRRSVPPAPGIVRLVPLVISLVGLLAATWLFGNADQSVVTLGAVGLAFAAVVASIALAGPWLTAAVGRALGRSARGASTLLAARRLDDDPRGSFGAIAGVIMAVFVASAFFTFGAYASAQAGRDTDPLLQPNAAVANLGGGGAMATADLADRVAGIPGVTGAVAVREVSLIVGESMVGVGWLASCPDVVRVLALDGAECAPGGLSTASGFVFEGSDLRIGRDSADPSDPIDPDAPSSPLAEVRVPSTGSAPLLDLEGDRAGFLPPLLIDPSALADPDGLNAFPITVLYATTDGSVGVGERLRTAIIRADPAGAVRLSEERVAADGQFAEIGRIVALGLVFTLALAGCSLAVAVTTSTLERRRQFVFLRSAGMSADGLRATLLLQAGVPLFAVATASSVLGAAVGVAILWVAAGVVSMPDASLLGVVAISLAVAMGVVGLTLPPLERMTRPASVRHE